MKTESVDISTLVLDAGNVRKHSPRNLDTIKASLKKFGQQKPIVVGADGVVVAGNGTLAVARALGWDKLDVVRTKLKGADAAAYAIADNRTAELAEWDHEALGKMLSTIDFDYESAGFTGADLESLLPPPEIVEDDVPEPPAKPTTKHGDLWLLGEHRLLCGDATVEADAGLVMDGVLYDLLLTDPPYGVAYVGGTKDKLTIEGDDKTAEELQILSDGAFGLAKSHAKPGASWYATVAPGPLHKVFCDTWSGLGVWRQTLVWVKNRLVLGRSDYHYKHEPVLYGWVPGESHRFYGDRKQTTILEFDRPTASPEHPTMKPVVLWAHLMGNSSQSGELVYDPFLGSGTTLIAAEQLGRKCYGLEIDPGYCDVIVKRWENLTSKKAVLDG